MAEIFPEGWESTQSLGEGTYGKVRLIVNRATRESVAVKILDIDQFSDAVEDISNEISVHRLLKHEHVIKFFGHRQDDNIVHIYLEYAAGGELFHRIKPHVGLPQQDAQRYFQQLIAGVDYLHCQGIAHRDLKPENLLLDDKDNIKIADFGMATVFRHDGKERLFLKVCGTLLYLAPEVLLCHYRAEPVDIWSCGVVLVALLTGELPWEKAALDCDKYRAWTDSETDETPWTKLSPLVFSLLRKMLMHSPSYRCTIPEIKDHEWFTKSFSYK